MELPTTKEFLETLKSQLPQQSIVQESFPWLPLPNESATDYMAFEIWRNMGSRRPTVSHQLSINMHWNARAIAFDTWRQAQSLELKTAADDISKSLVKGCESLVQALQVELVKTLRNLGNTSAPSLSLDQLVKALETVSKTVRLLTDKSTENIAVHTVQHNLTTLTQEELDELERLRQKTEIAVQD